MAVESIEFHQFRNLHDQKVSLHPGLQLVYGENAAGKTSFLESIHLGCSGKSFLAASPAKMLRFTSEGFCVKTMITQAAGPPTTLSFCWRSRDVEIRIGAKRANKTSDFAGLQPVQAITPVSYRLIDGGPDIRRRYLDWGVFHVKQEYADTWRQFQRVHTQRNRMLASGADSREFTAWDREYVSLAQKLHEMRAEYLDLLMPQIQQLSARLLGTEDLSVRYLPGWNTEMSLHDLLLNSLEQDRQRKFSYYGPQRADLSIRMSGHLVRDSASRGQKKLITYAMYLSQYWLLQRQGDKNGLLLIDDLPSELDRPHQRNILELLLENRMQVVMTCIDPRQLDLGAGEADKMFHVEHGAVREMIQ